MTFLDILLILPELLIFHLAFSFLWVGLYLRFRSPFLGFWNVAFNYYSSALVVGFLMLLINTPVECSIALNSAFVLTLNTFLFKLLLSVISLLILLVSGDSEKRYVNTHAAVEINFIRLIIILTLAVLISVNDFLLLFFTLEIYALSSYLLVGYKGKFSVFSSEAAIKYFILGTVFSIILAYGVALIYFTTGLTNFTDLQGYLSLFNFNDISLSPEVATLLMGAILILIGLLFKVAAAPFHFWSPDVYEGAPTTSMFILSIIPKIALFSLFLTLDFLWALELNWLLVFVGLVSVLVGSIGGLFQKRFKRLLAYSMINNTGFILLALTTLSFYGFTYIYFFLIVYSFSLIGLFTVLLTNRLAGTKVLIKNLEGLTNLFFINPSKALALSSLLFSSAGLPPFVGFIGKFFLLFSLTVAATNSYYALVVVLFLTPISIFYYIRILKIMAFNKRKFWIFLISTPPLSAFILSLSVFSLLMFFITADFLLLVSTLAFL